MSKLEFERLLKTALETAAINAESRVRRNVPRRFNVLLYGAGHSGDLMDVQTAVDALYLGEDRVYLIIDVAIVEIGKRFSTAFVRASSHRPGSFNQTWNNPVGSGPFKQLIPKEIKIIEE